LPIRRPIFNALKVGQIGYLEGTGAFDLSGKLCCSFSEGTGNLRDLETGTVVGHVSLDGFFVGSSWVRDRLFPELPGEISSIAPAAKAGAPEITPGQGANATDVADSSSPSADDPAVELALEMIQLTLQER
jgi:hypothetical protein